MIRVALNRDLADAGVQPNEKLHFVSVTGMTEFLTGFGEAPYQEITKDEYKECRTTV